MHKSTIIRGQLAFNRANLMLFLCGIGLVFSLVALLLAAINVHTDSLQQPALLVTGLLLFFSFFYYLRAKENYTLEFTQDALIIKSVFLNNPQSYPYHDITKVSIIGNLSQPKLNGIRIDLTYTKDGYLGRTNYAVHNLSEEDFKQVINRLLKANVVYHCHSLIQ